LRGYIPLSLISLERKFLDKGEATLPNGNLVNIRHPPLEG
jgi:hypothetical protein